MRVKSTSNRGRASRRWCAVLTVVGAVAALGADQPDDWRASTTALPAVTLPPNAPLAPAKPVPNRLQAIANQEPPVASPVAAPVLPIPTVMPATPEIPANPPAKPDLKPVLPAPAPAPAPSAVPSASIPPMAAIPAARVYVINGLNVLGRTGFSAMVDRIRDAGFSDTRSTPWYRANQFDRDIRKLHAEQPGTPVVIIGYSFGTYRARAIANRLTRDGIPVSMVGYVGGDYLRNSSSSMPSGAHVVNVTGNGFLLTGRNLLFRGTDLTGADNRRLNVNHLDLPKQQETIDALVSGINSSTTGIPTSGITTTDGVALSPMETHSVSSSPAALSGTAYRGTATKVENSVRFPLLNSFGKR